MPRILAAARTPTRWVYRALTMLLHTVSSMCQPSPIMSHGGNCGAELLSTFPN
jgi:hypothetical protein